MNFYNLLFLKLERKLEQSRSIKEFHIFSEQKNTSVTSSHNSKPMQNPTTAFERQHNLCT